MSDKIRVVIVDDHQIIRHGMEHLLTLSGEVDVVGGFSSGDDVLTYFRELQSDVSAFSFAPPIVIMDISMPGKTGIQTMYELFEIDKSIKVIFISMHDESQFALNLYRDGAYGYINKDTDVSVFVSAIKVVTFGKKYFAPEVMQQGPSSKKIQDPLKLLTKKELEVVKMLSNGLNPKQISAETNLSHKTILAHRDNARKKLNFDNNNQLMRFIYSSENIRQM